MMIQILCVVMGVVLIIGGLKPFTAKGRENDTPDKTSTGVAITSIVIGILLIIFGFVILPIIIQSL